MKNMPKAYRYLSLITAFFAVILLVSNYIFKMLVEVLLSPLTYRVVGWLKKEEQEDYYDFKTDFNPFRLK